MAVYGNPRCTLTQCHGNRSDSASAKRCLSGSDSASANRCLSGSDSASADRCLDSFQICCVHLFKGLHLWNAAFSQYSAIVSVSILFSATAANVGLSPNCDTPM